ncbi:uncharacterized protein LOC113225725 isoform X2 [Hyposmocoma kahamanoa]|uniref:uncharacterized protein LOC113225725 isoform X2 n=1 Tax=Hyposmocoma kahamanoa TaxID=1477025 RepID=UPI000E6D871D|nr:uncharacterized protein LOC113225725 isoform X2 [Hyposmocoma kahamanoa]
MRPLFSFRAVNFIIIIKPRLSIPTGLFHTEYTSYLPLSYIYYLSGLRGVRMPKTRSVALALLHAHVVAPAVAVVVCAGFQGLDHRIVRGALMSSTGGPCGWVSLSVCRSAHAPALIAASYGAALLAAPLAMIILCGRATVPPLGGILSTLLTTLTPFMLGTLMRTTEIAINSETTTKSPIARSSDCTTKSTKLWRELTTKYRVSTIKWRELCAWCPRTRCPAWRRLEVQAVPECAGPPLRLAPSQSALTLVGSHQPRAPRQVCPASPRFSSLPRRPYSLQQFTLKMFVMKIVKMMIR